MVRRRLTKCGARVWVLSFGTVKLITYLLCMSRARRTCVTHRASGCPRTCWDHTDRPSIDERRRACLNVDTCVGWCDGIWEKWAEGASPWFARYIVDQNCAYINTKLTAIDRERGRESERNRAVDCGVLWALGSL